MRRIASLIVTLALAGAALAQEAPPEEPAWKPFQEFGFALGSSSGTAESGGRVGGTVSRFSFEMNGNFLLHRVSTIFPAQEGKPEEALELLGYCAYDREARKYTATYYFSTGLMGFFDVEFQQDGSVRFTSTRLVNYDPGARARIVVTKKGEAGHDVALELASAGKEFSPYFSAKLTKK